MGDISVHLGHGGGVMQADHHVAGAQVVVDRDGRVHAVADGDAVLVHLGPAGREEDDPAVGLDGHTARSGDLLHGERDGEAHAQNGVAPDGGVGGELVDGGLLSHHVHAGLPEAGSGTQGAPVDLGQFVVALKLGRGGVGSPVAHTDHHVVFGD